MSEIVYDVLIPGVYFCDIIFTGFPQFPALGTEVYTKDVTVTVGGVMNTIIALRRLGVNVGWLGQIGDDFFSRFALDRAYSEGIDTSLLAPLDQPLRRVTVAVSYPQDRAFITYVDPSPNSIDLVLNALDKVRFKHLHFTGLQMDGRTPDLLRQVKANGITVSMDCQDRPATLETPYIREILSLVDIFMPNLGEAKKLTGCDTLEDTANILRQLVPLLIIKDGGNGAHAWNGDDYVFSPPIKVTPVDTTGAGDVFNAGFLAARFSGHDLATCMRWGGICGGLSTEGMGGTSTAPTREQVERIITYGSGSS